MKSDITTLVSGDDIFSKGEGLLYSGGLAVKAIFECRFADTFVFIWRFTVQKLLAVSVLRKHRKRFAVNEEKNYGDLRNENPPKIDPFLV